MRLDRSGLLGAPGWLRALLVAALLVFRAACIWGQTGGEAVDAPPRMETEQPSPDVPAGEEPGEDGIKEEAAVEAVAAPAAESPEPDEKDQAYKQIELLTEALLHIRKQYVEEKSYKDITYGALHGMLQALDPNSAFMEPEEFREMKEDTQGQFGGIGVEIGLRDGFLTIIAPIEDTPGFRAGLQSGDRILEIDGVRTMGLPIKDAVTKMRGPKGTKVVLKILSADGEEPRDVEIVRDQIEVASIKGARIIRHGVGYIRITKFAEPTAASLQEALTRLLDEGMQALVLDLRSNPGGLLKSAVAVAEKFLAKGDVVVATEGRAGIQNRAETRSGGAGHYLDFPMAVLVNGGSASASEIVAGALQDHKRAVVIGETSFGKATVQSLIPLRVDRQAAIRLTVAYYFTPNGRQIHEKGIEPDIVVPLTPGQWRDILIARNLAENPEASVDEEEKKKYAEVVDVQLERAVDLLHALRIFDARN